MTSPDSAPTGTAATDGTVVVIATVPVAEGRLDDALTIVAGNVPVVHAEDGCLTYAVHAATSPDRMVFVERWSSHEALAAHGAAPHMAATADALADLVTGPTELVLATSVPMGTAEQGVF